MRRAVVRDNHLVSLRGAATLTLYTSLIAFTALVTLGYQATQGQATPQRRAADAQVERGRYLVEIAGCNDCHTPGYAEAGGEAPDAALLTGDRLGYRGPWGTTYATNLRLTVGRMTEDAWLTYARGLTTRPPMPWFNLRAMTETDLRAMHRYIRSLGPGGSAAPAFVPPGTAPRPPYVQWPGVD